MRSPRAVMLIAILGGGLASASHRSLDSSDAQTASKHEDANVEAVGEPSGDHPSACYPLFHACTTTDECCAPNRCLDCRSRHRSRRGRRDDRARRRSVRASIASAARCARARRRARASATGHGSNARTLRSSASAGCVPVEPRFGLVDLVRVGRRRLRAAAAARAHRRRAAGARPSASASRAERGEAIVQLAAGFVARRSACAVRSSIGPVSRPASICIRSTPVSVSPAWIARWIGAAPRQRGSSEACTFQQPRRGMASTLRGRIRP